MACVITHVCFFLLNVGKDSGRSGWKRVIQRYCPKNDEEARTQGMSTISAKPIQVEKEHHLPTCAVLWYPTSQCLLVLRGS